MLEPRRLLSGGSWSAVTASAPVSVQTGVVLTDGTLMVHQNGDSAGWYKLTPSSTGSYIAGAWTKLANSSIGRLYTATEVLQSGKVLVVGGEYSTGTSFTNTGEIYDPSANTWTTITPFPKSSFGDDPSELLPNGNVLAGYISSAATYIYNPTANTWTATGSKLRSDQSDEESWVTLPDHSVISYDVFSSVSTGTPHSQRYFPTTGTWVDAGNLPAQLSAASVGYEMGPGLLLPDGRVFFTGGVDATAYYTPSTNSWAAGPPMPNGYVMADAPGAVLPDGDLLLAMSPQGGLVGGAYNFPSPTYVYEFNPTTNIYTDVTPAVSGFSMTRPSYEFTFLMLPTGQVAMMNDSGKVAVFTETGTVVPAAVPVFTGITYTGTPGTYVLSGTNLNGINEGAAYGDDNEMSSNYPLVRLTDSTGNVTYAKTTNWSLTGVVQGAETVTFTLPVTDTADAYLVQSVANGVGSNTLLAVLVNANSTSNVAVQMDAAVSSSVDVVNNGTVAATFPSSAFSGIDIVGDNAGDTLSINLNTNLGTISVTLQPGSGTDTLNVNQTSTVMPVIILPSAGNDAVNVGTTGATAAIAEFLAAQQIGLLTIGSGGDVVVGNGIRILLQANGVITTGTGVLDLTRSDMLIHAQSLSVVNSELATGFNAGSGGNWNGSGITSSAAAGDTTHLTTLGAIANTYDGGTHALYSSFDGATTIASDILIKYTYFGDANDSGRVDGSDYSLIDSASVTNLTNPSAVTGWFNGDFNYDGVVNGSDYTLIDNAFNTQGVSLAALIGPAVVLTKPVAGTNWIDSAAQNWDELHKKAKIAKNFFVNKSAIL